MKTVHGLTLYFCYCCCLGNPTVSSFLVLFLELPFLQTMVLQCPALGIYNDLGPFWETGGHGAEGIRLLHKALMSARCSLAPLGFRLAHPSASSLPVIRVSLP